MRPRRRLTAAVLIGLAAGWLVTTAPAQAATQHPAALSWVVTFRPILRTIFDTHHKRSLIKISQKIHIISTPPAGSVYTVTLYKWGPEKMGHTEPAIYAACGDNWRGRCKWRITQWWESGKSKTFHYNAKCTTGEYFISEAFFVPGDGVAFDYWPHNPRHPGHAPDRHDSWHILTCPKKGQTGGH